MRISHRAFGRLSALFFVILAWPAAAQLLAAPLDTPYGTVDVVKDTFENPAISGEADLAVTWAQGYLHAGDRFFQMDFNRRGSSGRAAELVGQSALTNDIQLRTLGLRRAARATWEALEDATQNLLTAYSEGVNAWLGSNPLPPEYKALELLEVHPWTPVDTLVITKALAFQLSFNLADIDLTIRASAYQQAGQIGDFDGAALFSEDTHRSQPPDDRVSVPGFLARIGGSDASEDAATGVHDPGIHEIVLDYNIGQVNAKVAAIAARWRKQISGIPLFEKALAPVKAGSGSNAWAVAGKHTASGNALIANDPHLTLDAPAIFVEERLIVSGADGYTIGGVAIPGIPGIVQGCTHVFCWGSTVNPMDVTDVFREELRTNNLGLPTHTVYQGQVEPLQRVLQSYFVNEVGDGIVDNVTRANVSLDAGGVTLIVPRRNHGPIVQVDGNTALSIQYTGWGATFELVAIIKINRARNLSEFEAALQYLDVGSQNFVYADVDGNIAYFTSAEMPIRADLQDDMQPAGGIPPWLIRDGTGTLNHEWLSVRNPQPNQAIPFEILTWQEMPKVINPAAGYVANANNDPIGTSLDNNPLNQVRPGGGLYYLNAGYAAYRLGRIDRELQRLISRGDVTVDDMIGLQGNHQLRDAEEMTPIITQAVANASAPNAWPGLAAFLGDPRVVEAANRLAAWDFSTPTGIQEGFDPGDDSANLPVPSQAEVDASVAATIFSTWRAQVLTHTIDGVLTNIGLGNVLPSERFSWNALAYQLRHFAQTNGMGASGIPFFNVTGTPDMATARDVILLKSLQDALDLLASNEFAPAFANSASQADYRWGRLHRVVFNHPLGSDPFNVPNGGGFTDLSPGLPGIARSGGYEAVDASRHSARANGVNEFMFGAGPARRFVAKMTVGGERLQVIPGGRSGIFLSPFYSNQLPLWLTNDYHDQP